MMPDWPSMNEAVPYAWTGGAGLVGRIMYHAQQVQRGKRKPWTLALLFDLPIALGMGWATYGLCVWGHLTAEPTISAAIASSYLGPFAIDRVVGWIGSRYFKEQA